MSSRMFTTEENEDESWISVSDLMAGLMIMFLFILVTYIHGIVKEQESLESSICQDLRKAFEGVFYRDGISICEGGVLVRFHEDDTLFDSGETYVKKPFRDILKHFFPRYLKVLVNYRDDIEEIRIEGHTDDEWHADAVSEIDAYYKNVVLSQGRTINIMKFLLFDIPEVKEQKNIMNWLTTSMTANGLSYSHPIVMENKEKAGEKIIDRDASRRVEFKVRLKNLTPLRALKESNDERRLEN